MKRIGNVITIISIILMAIIVIVTWVLKFRYPQLTDMQFFLKYWYLSVVALVDIALYGLGKGLDK